MVEYIIHVIDLLERLSGKLLGAYGPFVEHNSLASSKLPNISLLVLNQIIFCSKNYSELVVVPNCQSSHRYMTGCWIESKPQRWCHLFIMSNMHFFGWYAREYLWAWYHALLSGISLFHYSAHLVHYQPQQLLRQIYAAMTYIIFHIHIGDVGSELC